MVTSRRSEAGNCRVPAGVHVRAIFSPNLINCRTLEPHGGFRLPQEPPQLCLCIGCLCGRYNQGTDYGCSLSVGWHLLFILQSSLLEYFDYFHVRTNLSGYCSKLPTSALLSSPTLQTTAVTHVPSDHLFLPQIHHRSTRSSFQTLIEDTIQCNIANIHKSSIQFFSYLFRGTQHAFKFAFTTRKPNTHFFLLSGRQNRDILSILRTWLCYENVSYASGCRRHLRFGLDHSTTDT